MKTIIDPTTQDAANVYHNHNHLIIRTEVAEFAAAMEAKLKKNDHKTGWHQQPIEAHIKLLKIEIEEFMVALEYFGDEEAAKECVDIANFAMIIRDKLLARIKHKSLIDEEPRNAHLDLRERFTK